jgi:hypothetical protein
MLVTKFIQKSGINYGKYLEYICDWKVKKLKYLGKEFSVKKFSGACNI